MKILQLISTIICFSLSSTLYSQSLDDGIPNFETHDMMSAFMLEVAGASQTITTADSIWLVKLIDGNCVCAKLEDQEEVKNCRNDLFTILGLPEDGVKPSDLTEEQLNHTFLVFSLAGVMGKCPEHRH